MLEFSLKLDGDVCVEERGCYVKVHNIGCFLTVPPPDFQCQKEKGVAGNQSIVSRNIQCEQSPHWPKGFFLSSFWCWK